jgi:hypothetical protein
MVVNTILARSKLAEHGPASIRITTRPAPNPITMGRLHELIVGLRRT